MAELGGVCVKLIQFSDMKYALTVAKLGADVQAIEVVKACPNTGVTNVEAMKKFVDLLAELDCMMEEYKELLEQDQSALRKVGMEIKKQDIELMNLFK